MIPLQPNPETGFLESNKLSSFSSNDKVKFLELARECVERGEMPGVHSLLKAVGVARRTFEFHLSEDDAFHEAWEEVLDACEQRLVQTMYVNGQRPSGYMDRITWLRGYRPQRWNPDLKLQIMRDSASQNIQIDSAKKVIDAEIVPNSTETPAKNLQAGEKP